MRLHELKLHIPEYEALREGTKRYDIRNIDDREFHVDDLIQFQEWRSVPNLSGGFIGYTGRSLMAKITHMTAPGSWGLPGNLAVLGIEVIETIQPKKKVPTVAMPEAPAIPHAPAISGDLDF